MKLTPERREELSRTVCRFCVVPFPTPLMRVEHEAECPLAYG